MNKVEQIPPIVDYYPMKPMRPMKPSSLCLSTSVQSQKTSLTHEETNLITSSLLSSGVLNLPNPNFDLKYDDTSDGGSGSCSLVTTPTSVLTPNQTPMSSPRFQIEGEKTPENMSETPLSPISPLSPLSQHEDCGEIDDFEELDFLRKTMSDTSDEKRMVERKKCMTIKEIYDLYDKWFCEDENIN